MPRSIGAGTLPRCSHIRGQRPLRAAQLPAAHGLPLPPESQQWSMHLPWACFAANGCGRWAAAGAGATPHLLLEVATVLLIHQHKVEEVADGELVEDVVVRGGQLVGPQRQPAWAGAEGRRGWAGTRAGGRLGCGREVHPQRRQAGRRRQRTGRHNDDQRSWVG